MALGMIHFTVIIARRRTNAKLPASGLLRACIWGASWSTYYVIMACTAFLHFSSQSGLFHTHSSLLTSNVILVISGSSLWQDTQAKG